MNQADIELLNEKLAEKTTDIMVLKFIIGVLFSSVFVLCLIIKEKNAEKETLITKHNSALIELNARLESKEAEIKEAQEWLGIVFEEGADITNKYNELKKQCRKVKR